MTYSKAELDVSSSSNSFVHTRICTASLLSPAEGGGVLKPGLLLTRLCIETSLRSHTGKMAKRPENSKVMPQTPSKCETSEHSLKSRLHVGNLDRQFPRLQ